MIPCFTFALEKFRLKKILELGICIFRGTVFTKNPEPGLAVPPKYRLGATHDSICLTKYDISVWSQLTVCLSCAIDTFTSSFSLPFQIYIILCFYFKVKLHIKSLNVINEAIDRRIDERERH